MCFGRSDKSGDDYKHPEVRTIDQGQKIVAHQQLSTLTGRIAHIRPAPVKSLLL